MYLQRVSNTDYLGKKNNVSFKNRLIVDIGASDPRGTFKMLLIKNDGSPLFEYKGFINDTIQGFKDNNDFIKKVAKITDIESLIKKSVDFINDQIQNHKLPTKEIEKLKLKLEDLKTKQNILINQSEEDKKLTGLALALPGTIQNDIALFMANLRKNDQTSLTNVKLKNIVSEIKKNGKVKLSADFKFITSKDLACTALGVIKKVADRPRYRKNFSKRFYATVVQTGGGFADADIKVKNGLIDIETSESSHDLLHDSRTLTEKRLGKLGVSTSSVIENFATKLGIENSADIKVLIQTGLAQLATKNKIKLNTQKDKSAINVLTKTGIYESISKNSGTTTLKVKKDFMDKFNEASKYALQSYADAIALHAITKINRGANLYILSGPLAMGLNDTIKKAPGIYEAKNLRELIFNMINKHIKDDITCNKLRKTNHFNIVCSKSLSVDNNTSGGSLLLASNPITFPDKGEWMQILVKEILSQ